MCRYGTLRIIPRDSLILPLDNYASPGWIENFEGIPVDSCISDEIEYLILSGVRTLGCCCGHYRSNSATCLIHKESLDLIKQLGYEPYKFRPEEIGFEDRYEIKLKTPINRKLYYVIRYKLLPLRNRLLWWCKKFNQII